MADELADRLDGAIDAVVARGDATAALRDPELATLVRIAADLRHYPSANFKARLRAQLERRKTVSTAELTNIREGFTTVTPYVWVADRGLSDFLIRVFDAVETRVTAGGRHGTHRELRIGNSMLMLGEGATGEVVPGRSMAFHVFVDDVDAVYAKAIAAGDAVRVVEIDGLVLEVEPEAGGAEDYREKYRERKRRREAGEADGDADGEADGQADPGGAGS